MGTDIIATSYVRGVSDGTRKPEAVGKEEFGVLVKVECDHRGPNAFETQGVELLRVVMMYESPHV